MLVVEMKPHWLSSVWLRLTAQPFVRIDGRETTMRWGVPLSIPVEAGDHKVAGGIRYHAFPTLWGARDTSVHVGNGETVSLKVQNGLFNREPFYVRRVR
jgi:hypothetical protein